MISRTQIKSWIVYRVKHWPGDCLINLQLDCYILKILSDITVALLKSCGVFVSLVFIFKTKEFNPHILEEFLQQGEELE